MHATLISLLCNYGQSFFHLGKVEEPKWYPQDGITPHSKRHKMEFCIFEIIFICYIDVRSWSILLLLRLF